MAGVAAFAAGRYFAIGDISPGVAYALAAPIWAVEGLERLR
jgi:hypothetical protein